MIAKVDIDQDSPGVFMPVTSGVFSARLPRNREAPASSCRTPEAAVETPIKHAKQDTDSWSAIGHSGLAWQKIDPALDPHECRPMTSPSIQRGGAPQASQREQ